MLIGIGEGVIKDVVHFRIPPASRCIYVAIVVTRSGNCFAGTATPSDRDQKLGYTISVGRALRDLVYGSVCFQVDKGLEGRGLRDVCKRLYCR